MTKITIVHNGTRVVVEGDDTRLVADMARHTLDTISPLPKGVVLTGMGEKKIQVIKVVREHTGLGLAEAKALVESAHLGGVDLGTADMDEAAIARMVADLKAAGAEVVRR